MDEEDDDEDDVFENVYGNIDYIDEDPAKEADMEQGEEEEEEEVFENVYANVDKLRKEEPAARSEPIYATVQKNRKKPKGQDTDKYKKMSKRAEQKQDRRPMTPKRLEVHDGDYENLSPSPREMSPLESDDGRQSGSPRSLRLPVAFLFPCCSVLFWKQEDVTCGYSFLF